MKGVEPESARSGDSLESQFLCAMLWEYPWFPEPETFQLMGGASHHFSLPWLPSLCIISNNKPAQSEAIIESLLSADINGIPSSELLCGCLIGRHVGGSQPAPAVMLGMPAGVRSTPGWALGVTLDLGGLGYYRRKVKEDQGPSRSAWRLGNRGNLGRKEK